jgi:hypothetical protein
LRRRPRSIPSDDLARVVVPDTDPDAREEVTV